MSKQLYHNTARLARFILRRDRIRIPIWLIAISFITFITASSFTALYLTEIETQVIAETMRNPAMIAMVGPAYGIDNYTYGAMMANQMLLFTAIAVAIMSILLVSRHTRGDEEGGRIEVIRSLPVGRLSNLSATAIVLYVTNILLALIIGIGLYALSIESMDFEGSLLYGAALGATGIFFASLTALFAQLTENSRGTIGYSFAFLGFSYLIRAIGDVSSEALSWFSPLGWILRTEVYVNNYWWPIFITIGASLIILAIAFYLNSIRDMGAGFIPTRAGRKSASAILKTPIGLALRIQRVGIIAWLVGMFILGASYGSVLGDMERFLESSEMLRQILPPIEGVSLTEQYMTMLMTVISIASTIPALMMILKLKGEEKNHRTEHFLARAVSRNHLLGSYLLISIVVAFLAQLLAVIGLWLTGLAVMDDPISFSAIFSSAMVYLSAMWVMIGVAVLLIGFFPRATGISWLYLWYSFFVVYLGELLQLPEWMAKISPYGHIPKLPVEEVDFLKLSVLTALAIILVLVGFMGYNKRDIQG